MMSVGEDPIGSINGAAGAGFRLSLILNAVKMKMQNADAEIQRISKAISDFALVLKQVAITMQEGGVMPTPLAVDTVFDIKDHSERIFEEIKSMTELAQVRDEQGNLTEIGIGQKVVWCFKKQKVPYLLGQLDYLKLNLSIMLQILQLAKTISPTRPRPAEKFMMQERAEIQNMIVLQHWSYEDLKNLYGAASDEARQDSTSPNPEDPPPKYDDPADDVRLTVTAPPRPPKVEGTSQAMVQYQERPLQQLEESLHQALSKENRVLSASVPDIVNHLLHKWTQPDFSSYSKHSSSRALTHQKPTSNGRKYKPHVSSDEEDTTESEFDDSDRHSRGYFLEGPSPNSIKKNVRFKHQQAKVEDDTDEEEHRPRRSTRRHILNSDTDTSESSPPPPKSALQKPGHRRDSDNSNISNRPDPYPHAVYDRNRRPYSGPSAPRNSPPEKEAVRPGSSRSNPPSPRNMAPPPTHNQPWHGHAGYSTQSPGLRPPLQPQHQSFPPSPAIAQRIPSVGNNQYMPPQQYMPSPGSSPLALHGQYFPQQQQLQQYRQGSVGGGAMREQNRPAPRPSRSHHGSRGGSGEKLDKDRDKKDGSKNFKKGIGLGAAAAGLMELLSGLDGI